MKSSYGWSIYILFNYGIQEAFKDQIEGIVVIYDIRLILIDHYLYYFLSQHEIESFIGKKERDKSRLKKSGSLLTKILCLWVYK